MATVSHGIWIRGALATRSATNSRNGSSSPSTVCQSKAISHYSDQLETSWQSIGITLKPIARTLLRPMTGATVELMSGRASTGQPLVAASIMMCWVSRPGLAERHTSPALRPSLSSWRVTALTPITISRFFSVSEGLAVKSSPESGFFRNTSSPSLPILSASPLANFPRLAVFSTIFARREDDFGRVVTKIPAKSLPRQVYHYEAHYHSEYHLQSTF